MQRTFLKAKLHRATVTHAELDYEGSLAVDAELLIACGIHEYEQLHIYNISNGERFTTYALRAKAGSGVISENGAAAHKAQVGQQIIVCTYAVLDEQQWAAHRPTLVYVDSANRIVRSAHEIVTALD